MMYPTKKVKMAGALVCGDGGGRSRAGGRAVDPPRRAVDPPRRTPTSRRQEVASIPNCHENV